MNSALKTGLGVSHVNDGGRTSRRSSGIVGSSRSRPPGAGKLCGNGRGATSALATSAHAALPSGAAEWTGTAFMLSFFFFFSFFAASRTVPSDCALAYCAHAASCASGGSGGAVGALRDPLWCWLTVGACAGRGLNTAFLDDTTRAGWSGHLLLSAVGCSIAYHCAAHTRERRVRPAARCVRVRVCMFVSVCVHGVRGRVCLYGCVDRGGGL
jgi:hypothetical protein